MAKLSAHGAEVGRIEYATFRRAYMSDGVVLTDDGFGWKLHGKLKPGIVPSEAFERSKAKHEAKLQSRPSLAAYARAMKAIAPLSKRWKLAVSLQAMPDDPDGIWSECCDGYGDNIEADLDDICELCKLYGAALIESAALKSDGLN